MYGDEDEWETEERVIDEPEPIRDGGAPVHTFEIDAYLVLKVGDAAAIYDGDLIDVERLWEAVKGQSSPFLHVSYYDGCLRL